MITFFRWLIWKRNGQTTIKYPGFHCGCCGEYIKQEFEIPTYKSNGEWWDTWNLCDFCEHGNIII